MNTASISPQTLLTVPAAPPELARRFGAILAGLAALVARRFLRVPHLTRLTVLLWSRLGRAARRFERAVARVGKAPPASRVRAARVAGPRGARLPRGRGWLVRELGWEAAGFGCQLEALLAEPGMLAALADAPGLGRILRPVCRMLGVAVPVVTEAMAPEVVVAARVAPPVWHAAAPVDLEGVVGNGCYFSTSG